MDQYNTLQVSFSVKRLNGEYSQVENGQPIGKLGKKVVTSGPLPKLGDENKKQDANKEAYKYAAAVDKKPRPQSRGATSASRPSTANKIQQKKEPMPKRKIAASPIQQRPQAAKLGNTPVLPAKKNTDASGGGLFLRAKEPPLPPSARRGYIPMHKGWNCSTSGIRRDLLQISQDESISLYNTMRQAPSEVVQPRPKSASAVRKHGHPPIVRERKPKPVNEFARGLGGSSNIWSSQTYDDETEDRARPSKPTDYRSHAKFSTLLAELTPEQEDPFLRYPCVMATEAEDREKKGAAVPLSAVLDNTKGLEATVDPISTARQIHLRVRKFWLNQSDAIKEYWSALDNDGRLQFIKTIQPYTPISVNEPYFEESDGSKVDIPGTVLIHELTLESLVVADNMYYLFDHYTQFDDISVYGYDAVVTVRDISQRVGHSFAEELPKGEEPRIFNMFEGPDFGKCFKVQTEDTSGAVEVAKYISDGVMVEEQEFQIVWFRLNSIFALLGAFMDEYCVTVRGCHVCGNLAREDGQPLLQCSRCMFAYYCSPECQRTDWKTHKKLCKDIAKERSAVEQLHT